MAKKARRGASPNTGYAAEEKRFVEQVSALLEAAKFEVQHEFDLGKTGTIDLVFGRDDLGTYRRYAIEVALVQNADQLIAKFDQLHRYAAAKKSSEFDEYWLVSNLSYPERPRMRVHNRRNVRAFALKELERLLDRSKPKPRAVPKTGKARSKIGKAVETNEQEINLAIAGLVLQIDAKIEALRGERPNSDEAIAERDADVSVYERMRAELERIRDMVAAFRGGTAKEAAVVQSVTTFREGVQNWWHKGHEQIICKTFDSALFLSAVGVLSLMKADMKTGMVVAGSLIAGKSIAGALKKLPKKLPWSGG
jgi:hypothetical protein